MNILFYCFDDVLSELDTKRQDFVLNRIGGGQVLITCCEDEKPARVLTGRLFTILAGRNRVYAGTYDRLGK